MKKFDKANNKLFDLFFSVLKQAKFGKITVTDKKAVLFKHNGKFPGPNTKIIINDIQGLNFFFVKGSLGWAEAYINNYWSTNDLSNFLEWGARNFYHFSEYVRGKWYIIFFLRLKHLLNTNSRSGSRKNIKFHYDLGNDFYSKWLDGSMTYSSAIFENKKQKLIDAQKNKFKKLSDMCSVKENENILEVGCGWGSFSIFLAKFRKANVTAITISKKQFEAVKKKILKENLNEKVKVKLIDYRDVLGKFDKIVSVEMFEAVGEKYWKTYFNILKNKLKKDGKIGLQTITIKDNYFKTYRRFPDFIQTYIFPGGMLPSTEALKQNLDSLGLKVSEEFFFGEHYAQTLYNWKESFNRSWEDIKDIGFDLEFKRLWEYYLSYCEGGFRSGNINVGQFLIEKE